MPFFKIKNKYIFLYFDNYTKLNEIALKEKSPQWRVSSHIAGRKESKEAQKLREETINKLYKDLPYDDFYREWIYFDLEEHKAIIEDLPYLLYDYACINNLFSYREVHQDTDALQTLFPDLYYDNDCFYEIALFTSKRLFRKQELVFSTIIDTRDIISVKGELNDFIIKMKNKSIHFAETIKVI